MVGWVSGWLGGWVGGWLENWRIMLISTKIVVEVEVEIGNEDNLLVFFDKNQCCLHGPVWLYSRAVAGGLCTL